MNASRQVATPQSHGLRPSPTGTVRHKTARARGGLDPAAYYDMTADPARHYLLLRIRGVWDHDVFDMFAIDYLRVVRGMDASGGITHALVDASDYGFQSQDIVERFPELIIEASRGGTHRTAIVISKLVNKVQAKRAGEVLDARYFRTVEDASAWVFSTEA